MNRGFTVYINGEMRLEYDRNRRLPGKQRLFLDKMDDDMEQGIRLQGQSVCKPDLGQRCHYVAIELVNALLNSNEALVAATAAYLVNRNPDVSGIHADEAGEAVTIRLLYDSKP